MSKNFPCSCGFKGSLTSQNAAMLDQRSVAALLGISRARVSQIEQKALWKIKRALEAEARARNQTVGQWLFGDE
jgi:Sigma-70, region 4